MLIGLYTLCPPAYGNLYFDTFNLLWAVALSYYANREPHSASISEGSSQPRKELLIATNDHDSVDNLPSASFSPMKQRNIQVKIPL